MDRLIARGLVSRSVSEADARGRVVGLTADGVSLTDRLIEERLANEAAVLRGLTDRDRREFERLVSTLMRTVGSGCGPGVP